MEYTFKAGFKAKYYSKRLLRLQFQNIKRQYKIEIYSDFENNCWFAHHFGSEKSINATIQLKNYYNQLRTIEMTEILMYMLN